MPSERMQRRIEALLDEADAAITASDWTAVAEKARAALVIDADNADAITFLKIAEANGIASGGASRAEPSTAARAAGPPIAALPLSFAGGRYAVRRFLGEGGRKRVFLAHDSSLDRGVAFCLIRAEGLDPTGRQRVMREAQSVARLGQHPNLVTVHDIGEDGGNPYIVQEYMGGGDVAALIATAEEHRLPVERTLQVAKDVCRGLSFIHAGGMVHRDLKPANVFVASDGTAKIGDFGLAVALDRSRLTQHGMMLGTVSYMPPEQALGGETTPQADLYSLGAMLYEMVTGRPPFVGDDPTAVISQHINTPPVAPSWISELCPPSLEEVILQLLAKVPADRQKDAAEVLAALELVDPTQKSATHSDSNALDRLARGIFVGREKELERLRKAFDEAFAGRGSLVMLVGEPGIGKTRAAHELETYARMRGAQVLWGRSHEGSGAPPYWPWVQVGRQWGGANDLASIRAEVAPTRGELVRLFPELRQQPGFVEPEAVLDPQSAQFRLFDAFATYLRAMAGKGPLVVALDDLHWADKPTLLLLQHVARDLGRLRILVVCTYRDTDLSRTHPLSEALAGLNRDPGFQRVVLRGLSKDKVRTYIREAAHAEPKVQVLEKIFEETEGNPFFLSEVVNLLTQEGTLNKESVSDIAVPDGVKEALGRRLDRLSKETNDLLQVSAIIGREFAYDTLTLLGERDDNTLLGLIEESIEARVIEEMDQPGRYRFTHALMQETLLSELSTTRRVRLHGQVAEALEKRWGDRSEECASRLATHFLESSTLTPGHAEKARRYALVAARLAEGQAAWAEAARWYVVATAGDEDPEPDVLTALALAWDYSEVFGSQSRPVWDRALDGFRRRSDLPGFARAAAGIPLYGVTDPITLFREALSSADPRDFPTRAELLKRLILSMRELGTVNDQEVEALLDELYQLASHPSVVRGVALRAWVDGSRLAWQPGASHSSRAALSFFEAGRAYEEIGSVDDTFLAFWAATMLATQGGDLQVARQQSEAFLAWAERYRHSSGKVLAVVQLAALATLRWRPKEHETLGEAFSADYALADPVFGELTVRTGPGLAHGRFLDEPVPSVRMMALACYTAGVCLAQGPSAGLAPFESFASLWSAGIGNENARCEAASFVTFFLQQLGDEAFWRGVFEELRRFRRRCSPHSGLGLDPLRGQLALRLNLVDEADQCFREGLEWAEREDCPVELGRNLQGLAAVAERRGDVATALSLLDRAARQYQPRGVKLFLDQVIAAKVRLQGIGSQNMESSILAVSAAVQSEHPDLRPQAAPDGTVTLMFSDIENSTPLNERLGDAKYLELLHQHNALIESKVRAHHGYVVKTMGDGYMVAFKSAADGLGCAIAMQQAMVGMKEGVRIRIGLHTGEMLLEGDDFFGRHVTLASRVAGQASGGEIFVSDIVRELVNGQDFAFDDLGERPIKGFELPVRIWAARWQA